MTIATNGFAQTNSIPQHLAIIMDGNHRWARKKGLPGSVGHRVGAKNVRPIAEECADLGITYLTLFAFSTENWNRPKTEIDLLFELISTTLDENIDELHERDTRLRFIGDLSQFPAQLTKRLQIAERKTLDNSSLTLTIALNYGGKSDLVEATQKIGKAVQSGEIDYSAIDEDMIERNLSTDGIPCPDLCIRTGGDLRLSNFMLWQLAYSELYFAEAYWPDFGIAELHEAMHEYSMRDRRYGCRYDDAEPLQAAS